MQQITKFTHSITIMRYQLIWKH